MKSNAEKPGFTALEPPFRELRCRRTSVPTTAFRSLPQRSVQPLQGFQSCGCGSVSSWNPLNPGIPSRTVAMNAGSRSPPAPISYTSGPSSTISSKSSTIRRLIPAHLWPAGRWAFAVGVKGSRTRHLAGQFTGVRSLPHNFYRSGQPLKVVRDSSDGSEAVEIERGLLGDYNAMN